MRVPDWLVYATAAGVVGLTLLAHGDKDEPVFVETAGSAVAISSPASSLSEDRRLRPPHPLDEKVLVQVGAAEDGIGTAFAINTSGIWLTARHVVDGCTDVALARPDGQLVEVEDVRASRRSDLALLITDRAPAALLFGLDRDLKVGEGGFHMGFPQGRSGEAQSTLLSRSRLVTHGRYVLDEPVLAWMEDTRSGPAEGTLAGMSGGPVLDENGLVIGVTVAESPRRGRIYTATPESISAFLEEQGVMTLPTPPGLSDNRAHLAESHSVVEVVCRVAGDL